jgi:hypothetical protein
MKRKPYVDKVKGINWEFHLQSNAAYVRNHGKDSGAITYLGDKQVWFNQVQLSPGTVRHEVFHVYIASSGVSSATLTADNMEEIAAEIYESFGPEMDLLVDRILEHFLR